MLRSLLILPSLGAAAILSAQPLATPPISTDLNTGVPATWTVETDGSVGWYWASNVGTSTTGGLIMDCGSCAGYEESTLWTPWLDMSSDPSVDVTFHCAIIGGMMLLPPPVWVRRDGVGGPTYLYRYGVADLIPPPDEVIPSTIDLSPPLDLADVQWVYITYPFYAGLNDDSVRIGIGTGIPLGGWSLLDNVSIGQLSTITASTGSTGTIVLRTEDQVTIRSDRPIDRAELLDVSGRALDAFNTAGEVVVDVPLSGLVPALYLVRIWRDGAPTIVRVMR